MTAISDDALTRLRKGFGPPEFGGTRYEIVSTLGRGGMGVVYLARDTVLGREVALKVVDAAAATEAAFEQEPRVLAQLEHPGIVPVHDFGQLEDGRFFYAMKRIRGERLDRWAARAELHERLAAFLRVCDAVAFAHAHGVVHRDLKPDNVMVGEFGEVLVLDWGVARLAAADADASSPVVGTPEYMAPAQARGEAADVRADVFSLGVLLSALAPDVRAVQAIAAKAREVDPTRRYPTVMALSADVSRFLAGVAVLAHRETLGERALRVGRRYRLPIALMLTYVVVRVLLILVFRI